jgi:hypothetical protein
MLVASKLHLLRYFFVLTVLFTGAASYAQYSGNIQGFVVDPSGAAVTGATVILRNVDTAVENLSKTGDSGNYRFSSLPPGNYVVGRGGWIQENASELHIGYRPDSGN